MRRAAVAGVAALVLGLGGCPQKPPAQRLYPPPTVDELAATLRAQQAAVRSMNARVRATSWLGGERVRASVLMLATREGSLRFEAEVTLQGTVAILVVSGGGFAFLDLHHNELRQGPACPANVASLVRIPLEPPEVAAILLGDVALGDVPAGTGSVAWDPERGADVWNVPTAKGTAHVAFTGSDAGHRAVAGVSWDDPSGRRVWRTSYEDFEGAGPVRLPSLIRFAEKDGSFDDGVEVRFKDRTINVTPKPTDFTLAPPPGAAVREVGCGGG